ncbi:MAG: hypothetical protein DRN96_05340 [Thermoproteota archaeon]|nr:MAG: hypothetical protein DRN96_05340 [Candidatus Korarchaeota archaeon]
MGAEVEAEWLISILKDACKGIRGLKALVVFGSYAEGRVMPASDVDIAAVVEDPRALSELRCAVARALKLPEDKVSIVDLRKSPPTLRVKALKRGIVIFGSVSDVVKSIEPDVVEVLEHERESFYQWLEGIDPMDESVIMAIVRQVESDVRFLAKVLREKHPSEITGDEVLRRAFERALHTGIEGALDLLRHIISGLSLGVAEYYRDYVEIAVDSKVIPPEAGEKLLELVELRHKLVHRYRRLDYNDLIEKARAFIEVWPQVSSSVRRYLKEEAGSRRQL